MKQLEELFPELPAIHEAVKQTLLTGVEPELIIQCLEIMATAQRMKPMRSIKELNQLAGEHK